MDEDLGEQRVRGGALGAGRVRPQRRPDEPVPDGDRVRLEPQQPRLAGGLDVGRADPGGARRPVERARADPLVRDDEQHEAPRPRREPQVAAPVQRPQRAAGRQRPRRRGGTGQLAGGERGGEVADRAGAAVGQVGDRVGEGPADRVADRVAQHPQARVLVERPQPQQGDPGEPVRDPAVVAGGEQHRDRHVLHAARRERQRVQRHLVEPLHVVDPAQQRPVPGREGEQLAQRGVERERLGAARRAPHDGERRAVLVREPLQVVRQRAQQPVQSRVRDGRLAGDAGRADRPDVRSGAARGLVEQRGPAEAGVRDDREGAAAPVAGAGEQVPDGGQLGYASVQRLSSL
nr:hypothetical protein [Actinomadura rifamycini]